MTAPRRGRAGGCGAAWRGAARRGAGRPAAARPPDSQPSRHSSKRRRALGVHLHCCGAFALAVRRSKLHPPARCVPPARPPPTLGRRALSKHAPASSAPPSAYQQLFAHCRSLLRRAKPPEEVPLGTRSAWRAGAGRLLPRARNPAVGQPTSFLSSSTPCGVAEDGLIAV